MNGTLGLEKKNDISTSCLSVCLDRYEHLTRVSKKRVGDLSSPQTPALKKISVLSGSPASVFSICANELNDLCAFMKLISTREKDCSGWEKRTATSGYSSKNRAIMVDWMTEFCKDHKFHRQTLHLAADLLDRYIASDDGSYVMRRDLQLVGLSALILAMKNTESSRLNIRCMLQQSGVSEECVSRVTVLERRMLAGLDWLVQSSTLIETVLGVCKRLGEEVCVGKCAALSDFLLLHPRMRQFPLRDIALAVVRCVTNGVTNGVDMSHGLTSVLMPDLTSDMLNDLPCDLLCRVWVEGAWRDVKESVEGAESDGVFVETYNNSFLRLVAKDL